jgi:HPt (histidine-containing phosphotransfer) domain-containing protein
VTGEIYAKFLPQFTELARDRLQRAYEACAQPDEPTLTAVARELHAIAGEAGLLGLAAIVPIARNAEEHAKRLRDGRAGEDHAGAFVGALDELRAALDALAALAAPGAPKPGA